MPIRRSSMLLALAACTCLVGMPLQAQDAGGLATVHLADGSAVPLTGWSFSYDHLVWAKGTPQSLAASKTAHSRELWVDKKTYPVVGQTLELQYERPKGSPAPRVQKILLGPPSGKKRKLDPKPPHEDLLAPDADKDLLFLARTLDLTGQSLTGTPRTFCLVTYTSLVECATTPDSQVLSVEFN